MASFTSFSNRLPDPNWGLNDAGDGHASNYTEGPGFASVTFTSRQPAAVSRTNSGRVTTRAIQGQNWRIKITYNPMTRTQFEPVYAFLQECSHRYPSTNRVVANAARSTGRMFN